jgi:hypothetical protein
MSENRLPPGFPGNAINHYWLIKNKKGPYYDIVKFLFDEMNREYASKGCPEYITYTINPRVLQEEIEKRVEELNIEKPEKITSRNVCRSISALLYGSKLKEEKDFYVTTTSGGRKNYCVKVSKRTLNSVGHFL